MTIIRAKFSLDRLDMRGFVTPYMRGTHDRRCRPYGGEGGPNFDRLYHELKVLSVTVSDPTLGKTHKSICSCKAFFGCFFLNPNPLSPKRPPTKIDFLKEAKRYLRSITNF